LNSASFFGTAIFLQLYIIRQAIFIRGNPRPGSTARDKYGIFQVMPKAILGDEILGMNFPTLATFFSSAAPIFHV